MTPGNVAVVVLFVLFQIFSLSHCKAIIWRAYFANSYFCNSSPDSVHVRYPYSSGISCSVASWTSVCTVSSQGYDSYIERCVEISDSLSIHDASIVPPFSGEFIEVRGVSSTYRTCDSSLLTPTNQVKGYFKNNACALGYFSGIYKSRVSVTTSIAELYESCQVNSCNSGCTGNTPNRAYLSSSTPGLYCSNPADASRVTYRTVIGIDRPPSSVDNFSSIILGTSLSIIVSAVLLICCCALCCCCTCICILKRNQSKYPKRTTTVVMSTQPTQSYVPPIVPTQGTTYYTSYTTTTPQQMMSYQPQQQQHHSAQYYSATPQQLMPYPTQVYSDGNVYNHAYVNPTEMMQPTHSTTQQQEPNVETQPFLVHQNPTDNDFGNILADH